MFQYNWHSSSQVDISTP